MKTIVKVKFGSHLYGTNTPASDTDYKSVHLPSAEEMLLHTDKDVVTNKTKTDNSVKNTADDIDQESFALHRFFHMLEKGETMALEILFAPPHAIIESTKEWDQIVAVRDRLLTRNCTGLVGYCLRQCAKYGVKGGRVATSRAAMELLRGWQETWGPAKKLGFFADDIRDFVEDNEHTSVAKISQINGGQLEHWEICDRKLPFTVSISEAGKIVERLFLNYGERARAAEANEGIDWKAVSHAVRVGNQGMELLNTGHITFPRPDRDYLLQIKRGKISYKDLEPEIEWLMDALPLAAERSDLPEHADRELMNQIILRHYESQVLEAGPFMLPLACFAPENDNTQEQAVA